MHIFFMQCGAAQIASPRIFLAFYFLKFKFKALKTIQGQKKNRNQQKENL